MYSRVPATPSTTTLDDVAGGWLGSQRRSAAVSGWADGAELTPNDGSICPQTLGAKTTSGESFDGHSLGFHVGLYRNESFPEALLKLNQPAVGLGAVDALGDAAADVEAEPLGVTEAKDPEAVAALVPQAATPAPRRIRTPARTMARTPALLLVAWVLPDTRTTSCAAVRRAVRIYYYNVRSGGQIRRYRLRPTRRRVEQPGAGQHP